VPAPKERGSPSPTFGTKVGLGGKAQSYSVKLKAISKIISNYSKVFQIIPNKN